MTKTLIHKYIVPTLAVTACALACQVIFGGAMASVVAIVLIWICVSTLYARREWSSTAGMWVLAAAMCLISTGFFANVQMFTTGSGASACHPELLNTDSHAAWQNALKLLGEPTDGAPLQSQRGYGTLVAALLAVTGVNVTVPILFNMACIMLAILLTASVAVSVVCTPASDTRHKRRVATATIVIMTAQCYYLQMACLVLKEAVVIASCALIFRSIIGIYSHSDRMGAAYAGHARRAQRAEWTYWMAMACGLLFLSMARNNYILVMLVGVIILSPAFIRRGVAIRPAVMRCVIMAALCLGVYLFIGNYIHAKAVGNLIAGDDISYLALTSTQEPWASMIRDNGYNGNIQRLIWLPLSMAVQFLIPFPWNFTAHIDYGYTQVYAHFSYCWYAFGGIVIYGAGYIALHARRLWRERHSRVLVATTAFGVLFWIMPAYVYFGIVSRYTLSSYIALMPAAIYVLTHLTHSRHSRHSRRAMTIYAIVYTILLATTLIICYRLHQL